MKRTLATMGVVGLGLISLTAPAIAASDQAVLAHSDGGALIPLELNVNGTGGGNGNGGGTDNGGGNGGTNNGGGNGGGGTNNGGGNGGGGTDTGGGGTDTGGGGTDTGGGGTDTGGGNDGGSNITVDTTSGTSSAAVTPTAEHAQPAPAQQTAVVPKAAPAPVSVGTNQGYNAQTAVGAPEGLPDWFAGLGALAAAGTVVAVRRRSRPLHTAG